jgi:hypothetical protein
MNNAAAGSCPSRGAPLLLVAICTVVLLAGCSGQAPPATEAVSAPDSARGYRALFRGRVTGSEGKTRFRMAAALAPPNRVRLEFFPPVGGARLIIASDGSMTTALMPADRVYVRQPTTRESMEQLLGLPLEGEGLIALLTGQPMCAPDEAEQQVRSGRPGTFGRRPSWYEIECPPADLRYLARCRERGSDLKEATLREGLSGEMIVEIAYDDYVESAGARWPRQILMEIARSSTRVSLTATDGPQPGVLAREIFTPAIPAGFEMQPSLSTLPAPGLLGPPAEQER